MAMQYGFFDAVESNGSYDRVYGAAFFTHFINAYFCSAVPDGCFTVTKNSGLTLNVGSGHGIVGGVFFYDDSASTLTCASATGTRDDLVVARLNAAARTVTLEVKQNTSSAADNEVALAIVTVNGSTVTQVTQISYSQILRGASTVASPSSGGAPTVATGTTSGTLTTTPLKSTASPPTVYYSLKYTATRSGSKVTVTLTVTSWLPSDASYINSGTITAKARINGGAWTSSAIKDSESWKGKKERVRTLTLTANTTDKTAKVEFYVSRSGGDAGRLSTKSYSIKLP